MNPCMLNTDQAASGEMSDGMRDLVTRMLRELGFTPRGLAKIYHKPNPEYFYMVPYPRGFRIPDFANFRGEDARTTYEHIGQFLAQVNDVGITDLHKVKLFPLPPSSTFSIGSPHYHLI
jgi:hypothetical protein